MHHVPSRVGTSIPSQRNVSQVAIMTHSSTTITGCAVHADTLVLIIYQNTLAIGSMYQDSFASLRAPLQDTLIHQAGHATTVQILLYTMILVLEPVKHPAVIQLKQILPDSFVTIAITHLTQIYLMVVVFLPVVPISTTTCAIVAPQANAGQGLVARLLQ